MRCPDCNKFVSFNEEDPEVQSIDIDETGQVTIEVRIVNACADCGQELKDVTFTLEADHADDVKDHIGKGHELLIDEDGNERTQRSGYFKKGKFIPAYGRYAKSFYGASVNYTIACSCEKLSVSGMAEDDVQGSAMDELV